MEWTPFLDTFLVLFVFLRGRGVMWRTLSEYPRRAWVDLFEQGLEVSQVFFRLSGWENLDYAEEI